ncbi:hypothetical protein AVEN_119892-1 [Araneus ventricosus]|uniref:Uncharacterized protein n=1 Tax=Araneus ventricosus TaxID=182803 RepID=A0A4Y2QBP5_ARAVE|nr:hypothetical protein AVEN_142732-1 [Araneus ventricosus]GBN61578.1 hypothetical protein AVEN_15443-1 [Araneus ventricosus]GBN61629.1 hypothetical protein AVEN_123565-1 [Araneus ventricosus]GBN61663.1 hypothetical protein AVEN_119892-1 [Araneus ventricosus]
MTWTTPELAPPLQTSAPHQREDVWPLGMIKLAAVPIHVRSIVESGFEPGTLHPKSRLYHYATAAVSHREAKLSLLKRQVPISLYEVDLSGKRRVNILGTIYNPYWLHQAPLFKILSNNSA